jgi:hypothetical protein
MTAQTWPIFLKFPAGNIFCADAYAIASRQMRDPAIGQGFGDAGLGESFRAGQAGDGVRRFQRPVVAARDSFTRSAASAGSPPSIADTGHGFGV